MSDIVERLRALVIIDEVRSDNSLGREAAAEIERLRAALRVARDWSGNYRTVQRIVDDALKEEI